MDEVRIEAVEVKENRLVVGRLLPGTEIVKGIERICGENQVRYGIITCGIGSLTTARLVYVKPDDKNKIGIKYCDPITINGPLEIISLQGTIGQTEDNKPSIHIHGVLIDSNMNLIAGHFVEGCKILATMEISISSCDSTGIVRRYDEETGFMLFNFK